MLIRYSSTYGKALPDRSLRDLKKLFPRLQGFEVLPRRWIVERSFAWISHNCRMSKD